MVANKDWSVVFWATMFPLSWLLSAVLAIAAQTRAAGVASTGDRSFQSTLFLSIFLACFGLVGVRLLIGRAIDFEHRQVAITLAAISLLLSIGLIFYGLHTLDF